MFIDYIPLMLINMAAGLVLLACFIYNGLEAADRKKWISGFLITGIIALTNGCHMTWTWPLPGSYNVAFGETSILLGILFLGASLSLLRDWDLIPVAIYAFFASIAAVIVGIRIINLRLTNEPLISGIGFIITGLAGALAVPSIYLRRNHAFKLVVIILLLVAALIWARTGYKACWSHLSGLAKWVPITMR